MAFSNKEKKFYRSEVLRAFNAKDSGCRSRREAVRKQYDSLKGIYSPVSRRYEDPGYVFAKGGGCLVYSNDIEEALRGLYGDKYVDSFVRHGDDLDELYFRNCGKAFDHIAFEKPVRRSKKVRR